MTTNEFISNLQAKGVNVVFNQASTGYVSGISYSYQEMIITGAKLGNDFKWSSIKNTITMNKKEIAQQFTRACQSFSEGRKQMLDPNQPSISFEQVTNMLKEIEQTHSKIISNTESTPDSKSNVGKFVFRPSFQIARLAQADREFGRAVDPDSYRDINTVIKIPAVLPLATLLDGHRGGNDLGVGNQSHLPPDIGKKEEYKKKKKKRRGSK